MCRLVTLYVRGGFKFKVYCNRGTWTLPKAIKIQAGLGAKTEIEWEKFNFTLRTPVRLSAVL